MSLEKLWYEGSPYVYLVVGFGTWAALPGALAKACAALLVCASSTIIGMRYSYRKRLADAEATERRTQAASTRVARPASSWVRGGETFLYEALPYIYAIAGVAAMIAVPGALAKACGALLALMAAKILSMRASYRKQFARTRQALDKPT